ncbi:hypothetical protein AB3662_18170 [Sorangium cellulosum]|uniref:hypothetical protein n=1 Tax=Sorangium cellulosum TaxID=56 RepID=UPI003D9A6ABC
MLRSKSIADGTESLALQGLGAGRHDRDMADETDDPLLARFQRSGQRLVPCVQQR